MKKIHDRFSLSNITQSLVTMANVQLKQSLVDFMAVAYSKTAIIFY